VELVIEQEEVEKLIKEALRARGINLGESTMTIRRDNKKSTIRIVLKTRDR